MINFLDDTVTFFIPELWAAVDWSVAYVFLQQEFINALKSKLSATKIAETMNYDLAFVENTIATGHN